MPVIWECSLKSIGAAKLHASCQAMHDGENGPARLLLADTKILQIWKGSAAQMHSVSNLSDIVCHTAGTLSESQANSEYLQSAHLCRAGSCQPLRRAMVM